MVIFEVHFLAFQPKTAENESKTGPKSARKWGQKSLIFRSLNDLPNKWPEARGRGPIQGVP